MKWTQVYIDYKTNGSNVNCPQCGHSLNIETTTDSVTFSCKSCKAFRHFDELKKSKPAQK